MSVPLENGIEKNTCWFDLFSWYLGLVPRSTWCIYKLMTCTIPSRFSVQFVRTSFVGIFGGWKINGRAKTIEVSEAQIWGGTYPCHEFKLKKTWGIWLPEKLFNQNSSLKGEKKGHFRWFCVAIFLLHFPSTVLPCSTVYLVPWHILRISMVEWW